MGAPTSAADAGAGGKSAKNRQLLALLLVALVLVAVVAAYFMFVAGGSKSDSSTLGSGGTHARPVASASNTAVAGAAGVSAIPAVYPAPPGHNPFKPLAVEPPPPAPSTSARSSATPSPSPSPSPTIVIPAPTKASPTPTVTVTATPSPTSLPTAGQSITLTLVSVDSTAGTADVTVKQGTTTTPYNGLKPGQVFGTYFKLVSILSSDPSTPPVTYGADFEYGDQFVQLATGEWSQFG
jgi:hypothetical protein